MFADNKLVGCIDGLASPAQAREAGDYLKVGFNCGFKLIRSTSQAMIDAGIQAKMSVHDDSDDFPNGIVPDEHIVDRIYSNMRDADLVALLSVTGPSQPL